MISSHNIRHQSSRTLMAVDTFTPCRVFFSLAVPSIPFTLQSLALPCLVLAGCLAEDSEASGSRTQLC